MLRDGRQQEMSMFDLLVGDVLYVGYGDILVVDGILIDGNNIRCLTYSSPQNSERFGCR